MVGLNTYFKASNLLQQQQQKQIKLFGILKVFQPFCLVSKNSNIQHKVYTNLLCTDAVDLTEYFPWLFGLHDDRLTSMEPVHTHKGINEWNTGMPLKMDYDHL